MAHQEETITDRQFGRGRDEIGENTGRCATRVAASNNNKVMCGNIANSIKSEKGFGLGSLFHTAYLAL